jgi:hypothetical protein
LLNWGLKPWADTVSESCGTTSKSPQFTGGIFAGSDNPVVQNINFFLCIILQFFKDSLSTKSGFAINLIFIPAIASVLGLMHIEASRKRSWLLWPGIVALVGQLVGISVTFPLLWVAQYIIGWSPPDSSWTIRRGRLSAAFFGIFWVFCIPTFGMLFITEKNMWLLHSKIFQIAPAVPAVISLFSPSGSDGETKAKQLKSVSSVMLILAGIGAASHLLGILQIIENSAVLQDMVNSVFRPTGSQRTEFFLWVDFGVILLSLIIFIAWETKSIDAVLKFTTFSSLFSPSVSLAWFVIEREEKILEAMLTGSNDKAKKTN